MDFSRFTTISFDCYGTLIDWEAGMLPVLRSILSRHSCDLPDAAILELYGNYEAEAESGPYQSYRDVLKSVVGAFGKQFDFQPSAAEIDSLPESVPSWPPFSDTVEALARLKKRYKLAVISNIDNDLFAHTRKLLSIDFDDDSDDDFDAVVTAEQVRSYKPALQNFQMALQTLGIKPEQLLHAGQSIYHDVLPAQALGIATVWVNRKSARPGIGAVRPAQGHPDLEVADLETLASMAA